MKLLITIRLAVLPAIIFCLSCQSTPKPGKYSLLLWEEEKDSVDMRNHRYILSKLTLNDSGFTRQELYRDSASTEIGYHDYVVSMFEDRYLIGHRGNVFDLVEKKFIYRNEDMDHFIKQTHDSVIFSRTKYPFYFLRDRKPRMNISSQYYYFDLRNKKIVEITSGDRYRLDKQPSADHLYMPYAFERGSLSPDGKRLVYFLVTGKGNNIWSGFDTIKVCDWSNAKIVSGELWMLKSPVDSVKLMDSVSMKQGTGFFDHFSAIWIDNDHLLTEYDWGKLAKINTRTGEINKILIEESPFECPIYTTLEKSTAGTFIYKCITPEYFTFRVDLEKLKLVPEKDIAVVGNIRYESLRPNHEWWGNYTHNGRLLFPEDTSSTAEHAVRDQFIAIETKKYYADTLSKMYGYSQDIHVFDTAGKRIAKVAIGIDRLRQIIGWIKE